VLGTGLNEALVFDLTDALSGGAAAGSASRKFRRRNTYILADWNVGPFVHGFESTRYYALARRCSPTAALFELVCGFRHDGSGESER